MEIVIEKLCTGKKELISKGSLILILNNKQSYEFMPILNGATIRRSRWQEKRARKRLQQQDSAVGDTVDSFGDWCQLYILLSDALRLLSIPQTQVCIVTEI